jgi:hypothetical protein
MIHKPLGPFDEVERRLIDGHIGSKEKGPLSGPSGKFGNGHIVHRSGGVPLRPARASAAAEFNGWRPRGPTVPESINGTL